VQLHQLRFQIFLPAGHVVALPQAIIQAAAQHVMLLAMDVGPVALLVVLHVLLGTVGVEPTV